jgi:FHA domain/Domain of unknown function (DUF1707)
MRKKFDMRPRAMDNLAMATTDAPTPLPVRVSEAERERVARVLRAGVVDGRISTDTLIERVELALGARNRGELDDLVADVQRPGPLRRAALRAVTWLSSLSADLAAAWRTPRTPLLALPGPSEPLTTIGRSPECRVLLTEPSVSRRHAQLRHDGDRWLLRDLGSRNGTRLNGMRITGEVEVRPGDVIGLGELRFRASARAR